MTPTPPADPNEATADILSTFRRYDELNAYFDEHPGELSFALAQLLWARYEAATDAGASQLYNFLANEVYRMRCRQLCGEFINAGDDAVAKELLLENYGALVNQVTAKFFGELLAAYAGQELQSAMVGMRQFQLCQWTVEQFIYTSDWPFKKQVLSSGLDWLGGPICLDILAEMRDTPGAAQANAANLLRIIERCVNGEKEAVIRELELGTLFARFAKHEDTAMNELFRQALDIADEEVLSSVAEGYSDLKEALKRAGTSEEEQVQHEVLYAYRNLFVVIRREEQPVLHGLIRQRIGRCLADTQFGVRADNIDGAIAAFEDARSVFDPVTEFRLWCMINYDLGELYRIRRRGDFAEDKEAAIFAYTQALGHFTVQDHPHDHASIQNILGLLYLERIGGDYSANCESAIACLSAALAIKTFAVAPLDWAVSKSNLGKAYERRVMGVPAENKDLSIACFEEALLVPDQPIEISVRQHNLGCSYATRISGDLADNQEKALEWLEKALAIRERHGFLAEEANTLTNLGVVLLERVSGNLQDNLERALAYQLRAIAIYAEMPDRTIEWARLHNNLCNTYRLRLRGDQAENIETAIAAARQGLTVLGERSFPRDWALLQRSLGNCYALRKRGTRQDNLILAQDAVLASLTVYSAEGTPEDWAQSQNALGNIYANLGELDAAIAAYLASATIYTAERHPMEWANANHNLGLTYFRLPEEREANLKRALDAQLEALKFYDSDRFTQIWSSIQHNLGVIYAAPEFANLEAALRHVRLALTIRRPETMPHECRSSAVFLGDLYYGSGSLAEAREAYALAQQALEFIRTDSGNTESLTRLGRENADWYGRLVECCLRLEDIPAAAAYAVNAKSRTLASELAGAPQELSALRAADTGLDAALHAITEQQQVLEGLLSMYLQGSAELSAPIAELRTTIDAAFNDVLFRYPAISAVQPVPFFGVDELSALSELGGGQVLVEYVQHAGGFGAFVFSGGELLYVALPGDLLVLIGGDLEAIIDHSFWKNPGHRERLKAIYDLVFAPLNRSLPDSGNLVIGPTSLLHLVPFQALMDVDGRYLAERYAMTFTPSLAALLVQHRQYGLRPAQDLHSSRLLNIAHSGYGDIYLESVAVEAKAVASFFADQLPLAEEEATVEAVIEAAGSSPFDVIHFNCHGAYDYGATGLSGLSLANGSVLTVSEIRSRLRLKGRPLVALSACQTGQVKPERGDETTGIAWAFTAAGAWSVLASQWSVPALETRELFEIFYRLFRDDRHTPAENLKNAIAELRERKPTIAAIPFFWAAFQATGLPLKNQLDISSSQPVRQ